VTSTPITTVDVLLPVRLPAPWLEETLRGLNAQTTDLWHLVCVIHGEVGGLDALVRRLVPDATIVFVPAEKSFVYTLNLGLSKCSAKYIARIDADDIPEPTRIMSQSQFLDAHPKVGLVSSNVTWIDSNGKVIRIDQASKHEILRGLRWKNVVAHPSVMMRRQAVLETNGYSEKATHAEDYELWLRLATTWELARIESPLIRYRVHENQVTKTKVIPSKSRQAILEARLNLARTREESSLAARLRHAIWSVPQNFRSLRAKH